MQILTLLKKEHQLEPVLIKNQYVIPKITKPIQHVNDLSAIQRITKQWDWNKYANVQFAILKVIKKLVWTKTAIQFVILKNIKQLDYKKSAALAEHQTSVALPLTKLGCTMVKLGMTSLPCLFHETDPLAHWFKHLMEL